MKDSKIKLEVGQVWVGRTITTEILKISGNTVEIRDYWNEGNEVYKEYGKYVEEYTSPLDAQTDSLNELSVLQPTKGDHFDNIYLRLK